MLARVANSLYWTGRYIERSEHLSRYLRVQYFSIFDAPMSLQKEVILRSISYMAPVASPIKQSQIHSQEQEQEQQQQEQSTEINEQEILVDVAFNLNNNNSIFFSVQAARENARSVRYVISTELWEAINRYYHFIKSYNVDFYKTRGLYDFTTKANEHCSNILSYANATLFHDDVWAFFKLGVYLERAFQIIRILNNKIIDINILTNNNQEDPLATYQWTTTLKTLETFDMYRRYCKEVKVEQVIQFLLTQSKLPRSVAFTLKRMNFYLSQLTFAVSSDSQLQFQANKLKNQFEFLEYEEIADDVQGFLLDTLGKIAHLNNLIEQEYFK